MSGKRIGEICECDHTRASRIGSGQAGVTIEQFCDLLEEMNLKIVDADKLCVARDTYNFMRQVTSRVLASEQAARDALEEDPE